MQNESENFSAEYMPSCSERVLVVPRVVIFFIRCRLLPEFTVLVSIPAVLADRLDDPNGTEDVAVQLSLVYIPSQDA